MDDKMTDIFYKEVLQAVLLFKSETLAINLCIRRMLGGFHHWVNKRMTGKQPWRGAYGTCR